ncbi:MAG: putative Fe-S cluster assembly protein SufT [Verrucomicrobia bacterium]|nr:MAG: putative Fe-S cluster assembly protein SufT [Verrucomicrobiota bacterium]
METPQLVTLTRDVQASIVPAGTPVTLKAGEQARITQALGGSFTVVVNGNMFRIEARDADALGLKPEHAGAGLPDAHANAPETPEELEKLVWDTLKTCYDPEIPVNIVDLGLVYGVTVEPLGERRYKVDVKMTLTAPGCGMGPVIQEEARQKLLTLPGVVEANVDLVWDPPWTQDMLTEAARLELGLM